MSSPPPSAPRPSQGEIWLVKLPTEPPDKGLRPVIVVSPDAQNHHPRATTLLVVPLSTTLTNFPGLRLQPGETGLAAESEVWPRQITVVPKSALRTPRNPLRKLNHATICKIAGCIVRALGVLPSEIS